MYFERPFLSSPTRAEVDQVLSGMVRDDFLRTSEPTLKSAYDRQVRQAEATGIPVTGYKAIQHWIAREVSPQMLILARQGVERLKHIYPR